MVGMALFPGIEGTVFCTAEYFQGFIWNITANRRIGRSGSIKKRRTFCLFRVTGTGPVHLNIWPAAAIVPVIAAAHYIAL